MRSWTRGHIAAVLVVGQFRLGIQTDPLPQSCAGSVFPNKEKVLAPVVDVSDYSYLIPFLGSNLSAFITPVAVSATAESPIWKVSCVPELVLIVSICFLELTTVPSVFSIGPAPRLCRETAVRSANAPKPPPM